MKFHLENGFLLKLPCDNNVCASYNVMIGVVIHNMQMTVMLTNDLAEAYDFPWPIRTAYCVHQLSQSGIRSNRWDQWALRIECDVQGSKLEACRRALVLVE